MSYRKITDLDDLSSNLGDSGSLDFFVGAVGGQLGKIDAAAMATALDLSGLAETSDAISELQEATSVAESVAEGLTNLSEVYSSLVESALYTDGTDEFANRIMECLGYGCLIFTTTEENEEVYLTAMYTYFDAIYADGKAVELSGDAVTGWYDTSATTYPLSCTFAEAGEHAVWVKAKTTQTTFHKAFHGCEKMTKVAVTPFRLCTAATNFANLFSSCYLLASVPDDMFDTCTAATDFTNLFNSCYLLASVPDGMFDTCTEVTSFSNVFNACSALTEAPDGLFANHYKVTNFRGTFANCTSLVRAAVDFHLDACTNFTNTLYVTSGCPVEVVTIYNLGAQEDLDTTSAFTSATSWGSTDEGLKSLVDTLYTNSFDRAAAGYEALSITLPEDVYNRLSDDEVSAIVAKGFTLATE